MSDNSMPSVKPPSVGLIILAAGASTRLGTPKQLLPFRGRSLLVHAYETALASVCRPVIVVVGAQAQRMRTVMQDLPAQVVENAAWSEGMGSSIRAGMAAAQDYKGLEAVVLMVCDQPLLTPQVIDSLVQTHRATGKDIVASHYADTVGVPALFGASLFHELSELSGTEGAKRLLARYPDAVASVPFAGGSVDIDTAQDYAQL